MVAAEEDYRIMQDFATPIKREPLLNALSDNTLSGMDLGRKRITAGAPEQVTSRNVLAGAFENLQDSLNKVTPIESFSESELAQLGIPSTAKGQVFEPDLKGSFGTEMQKLPNYVRQLFEAGQITEDELARLTPAMAVERRLDEGMKKELELAKRARSLVDATPEVKRYEDNSRWVNLRPKDDDWDTAKNILQNESAHLHHCIGQSCYMKTYLDRMKAGTYDYYSLRDPSGTPKVTLEVLRPTVRSGDRFMDMNPEDKAEAVKGYIADGYPHEYAEKHLTEENPYVFVMQDGKQVIVKTDRPQLVEWYQQFLYPEVNQIKSHGNTAPSEHYQEKVTDFLTLLNPRSIVESSSHHRMLPVSEALTKDEIRAATDAGIHMPKYVSTTRRDEIRRELGSTTPVEYRSTPDPGYTVDPDLPDADIGLFD